MRTADDQPSVNALLRADPIVHYTIKFTVNEHLARKQSSTARFDRHPFAELLRMDQFLEHGGPGRVRWQEDRVLVESQPTCSPRLEIPPGIHTLIHHAAGGSEVGRDSINLGLMEAGPSVPT